MSNHELKDTFGWHYLDHMLEIIRIRLWYRQQVPIKLPAYRHPVPPAPPNTPAPSRPSSPEVNGFKK